MGIPGCTAGRAILIAALLLSPFSVAAEPSGFGHPDSPAGRLAAVCTTDDLDQKVGRMTQTKLAEHQRNVIKSLRVLPPGSPMTMDYRANRLNIEIDETGEIARVFCG